MAKKEDEIKFIDLFAGLGGIRLGFEQALKEHGLKGQCVFTSEIKKAAIRAYNNNFTERVIEKTDITDPSSYTIPHFSVLLGGFPCQAFSTAGQQKGFADTRGTLFFEIQRILSEHLNEVDGFIMENVEGLVRHDKEIKDDKEGRTLKIIMHVLRNELNYNADYVVLDASEFGVPQKRKRIYIVGCKKKYGKIDLKFTPMPEVGVGPFLEKGKECLNNEFSNQLLKFKKPSELVGMALKDKRGGSQNIGSS